VALPFTLKLKILRQKKKNYGNSKEIKNHHARIKSSKKIKIL
jgi:hypothetical protein